MLSLPGVLRNGRSLVDCGEWNNGRQACRVLALLDREMLAREANGRRQ